MKFKINKELYKFKNFSEIIFNTKIIINMKIKMFFLIFQVFSLRINYTMLIMSNKFYNLFLISKKK